MTAYRRCRLEVKKKFNRLIRSFEELFYYGCDVDRWLPEIILLPYISLPWKTDSIWYRIIGPPGSGKSRHLALLEDYDLSYVIDEFTPKSFISGFRGSGGQDPSHLPNFNGKVLIISDEATLMEQRQEDRNVVQSILRKAYDGRVAKVFGNIAEKQEYKAHFNLLVASTPQIDRYFLYNQALGERYINYRLQIPDRIALTERAYYNQFHNFSKRFNKLKRKVHKFLDEFPDVKITDVRISDKMTKYFINCANIVALMRTHINRDSTGRYVTTLPQSESPGRLIQQITQVAIADALIRGDSKVTMEHAAKATYLGLGSIMAVISFVLYHVLEFTKECSQKRKPAWFSIQYMVIRTALGRGTIAKILEDLAIHRILGIRQGSKQGGRLIEYCLTESMFELIESLHLFKHYLPPCKEILILKRVDRERIKKIRKKRVVRKKKNES